MATDEMGIALGPQWRRDGNEWWQGDPGGMAVGCTATGGTWYVDQFQGCDEVRMECPSPEAAIAVAHLLVAAQRVAAGNWLDFYAAERLSSIAMGLPPADLATGEHEPRTTPTSPNR